MATHDVFSATLAFASRLRHCRADLAASKTRDTKYTLASEQAGRPTDSRSYAPVPVIPYIGPCAPISFQGILPLSQEVMTANTGGIRETRPSSLRNLNQK